MSLTPDQIERIAQLARIAVPAGEADAVRERLNRVLGMIDQLLAVDTAGTEPMSHALDVVQPLRPDVVTEQDQRELIQSQAPAVEAGLYLVPKVIEYVLDSTVGELRSALERGQASSVELTQAFLGRIHALNGALNAFISVDDETSLAQARAADALRARGEAGPLTGIPVAHKDIFCTRDLRTTCGSRMLADYESPFDAHVVEQFERAGAVLLGKTNMDEFAMGSSNETSHFGPVRNPWDRTRVPGGSSGGSAVAVAARMAPVATGTDTGGSIRQPAALTGVCGLKPTYGLVSRYGMIAFASSLDQAGVLTQTAADAALLLEVLAGFDARDSTSLDEPVPRYSQLVGEPWDDVTIGVPESFFDDGLDPDNAAAVRAALAELEKLGAKLKSIELKYIHLAVPA